MSTHPGVLWAQRSSESQPEKNVVFLTINLPDIVEDTVQYTLTPTNLSFKARTKSGTSDYELNLEFFAEVIPENSTKQLTSRSLSAVIRKKDNKVDYWPQLVKEKKTPFIKTNFEKWVDEDDQDGNAGPDDAEFGGFPGASGDFGGFPGAGSNFDFSKLSGGLGGDAANPEAAESDSDDDGPPPLEDTELSK